MKSAASQVDRESVKTAKKGKKRVRYSCTYISMNCHLSRISCINCHKFNVSPCLLSPSLTPVPSLFPNSLAF